MKILNKIKNLLMSLFMSFNILCINVYADSFPAETESNFLDTLKPFLEEYRFLLNAFVGFTVITSILVVIINLMRLAFQAGEHPIMRKQVERDLLTSFICLALLGGAGAIYAVILAIVF